MSHVTVRYAAFYLRQHSLNISYWLENTLSLNVTSKKTFSVKFTCNFLPSTANQTHCQPRRPQYAHNLHEITNIPSYTNSPTRFRDQTSSWGDTLTKINIIISLWGWWFIAEICKRVRMPYMDYLWFYTNCVHMRCMQVIVITLRDTFIWD